MSLDVANCCKEPIQKWGWNCKKNKRHCKNIDLHLRKIFTKGQIQKLKTGDRTQNYTADDMAKSFKLFTASRHMYRLLRKNKFPLPAISTLEQWAQKTQISPGVLRPVIEICNNSNTTETQNLCVLSFDEMKLRKSYCYDESTDSTLNPANYVQVAMIRGNFFDLNSFTKYLHNYIWIYYKGLEADWKQPIFYEFDCQMTAQILKTILKITLEIGFIIVAIVCDLSAGNRALMDELDVHCNKPW